jgi:hypothetical protein
VLPENPDRYFAIQIGGGIISPTLHAPNISRPNDCEPRFHWELGVVRSKQAYDKSYAKTDPMRIGTPATVNRNCVIDERACWNSSTPAFEILGVNESFWTYDESQTGLSAGQYALLQHNRTKHNIRGTTLKSRMLDDVHNKSYLARDILNDLSGVQVSFCTGVARRVALRELMADVMPTIAAVFPQDKVIWEQLNDQDQAIQAFHSASLPDWFKTLPHNHAEFLDQLVGRVLSILQPTGVNEEGNELTVAWIYQRPPYRCFKIPTNSKPNSWMCVLTDSSDCATFAYITTNCLETNTIKWRGPSPRWHSTAPLLETAVLRHNLQPSIPLGPLEAQEDILLQENGLASSSSC